MRRRSFLAGVAAGAGALSGCVITDSLVDSGLSEREHPERPAELTPESVVQYVADYEEVRVHNYHADTGASEVTVETAATFDHELAGGYHATVQHAGTVYHDREGERTVGELYSTPVPYRVTPTATRRCSVTHETVLSGPNSADLDDDPADPPLGVRVPNFTDGSQELTVTVIADGGNGAIASETTVDVDPDSAVELQSMAIAPETYRVVARLESNGVTGEGRVLVDVPGVDREADVDVLLSSEGLSTRPLPPFEQV